jgi:hypothetical protein
MEGRQRAKGGALMVDSDGRLPRFSRFEYILDLLSTVHDGGAKGSELAAVQKALSDRKESFEQVKLLAVGKRKSVNRGVEGTEELTRECLSFAVKSGLVSVDVSPHGRLTLTDLGCELLAAGKKNGVSRAFIERVASLYLSSYKRASDALLAILGREGGQVDIPDTRHGGRLTPEQIEEILGVRCDAVSLISFRLLLDQAQLVNWFAFTEGNGRPMWRIYATCKIFDASDPQHRGDGVLSFRSQGRTVTIKINQTSIEEFEDAAWSEYMKLTDNYEDIPVYYWQLRSPVCYRLRISDSTYDSLLLAMKDSSRFRFSWSSGSMPSSEAKGNLLKNLPPMAADGYHMVYVSMSRRKTG